MFLSPELGLIGRGSRLKQSNPKSDVWSLGRILYLLITGGVNDKSHVEYFDFTGDIWTEVSEELLAFIKMMVVIEVN